MERLGCMCTTAENGSVALTLLLAKEEGREGNNFDITFLDNQMPILSGTEVVKRLRDLGRDDVSLSPLTFPRRVEMDCELMGCSIQLVCGVTANALREDQEEYIALGASFVLTKPVTEVSLRGMLRTAAERRETTSPSSSASS